MQQTPAPTDGTVLAALVDEFTDRYLRGEPIDVESFASAYPALADLLRQVLPPIEALGRRGESVTATLTASLPVDQPQIPGYEIESELGRGGMGVVYRARNLDLNRLVALKVIRLDPTSGTARERFRTETQAVARLHHPGIVQIFEVGEVGGLAYCALELIEGGSLAEAVDGEPQPPRRAAELVEQIADAVQLAHEHRLIHRDLKPANVLLGEGGRPKVTDFGLAKRLDVELGQTQTGAIVGTPSYVAPEQAAGEKTLTPAVDVHALGTILYELLTGRPPFKGTTLLETLQLVRHAEPVSPRRLQPGCPRDLEVIVLKCLRKEPGRRYATARELADDLRRFLDGRPIRARSASAPERAWLWIRRNPSLAFLVTSLAAALTAGAIVSGLLAIRWHNAAVDAQAHADRADEQRRAADEALFEMLLTQARSIRQRGGRGQRVESLRLLDQAVALWRKEDLSDRSRRESQLRDDIMSSLMRPDLQVAREISCPASGVAAVTFDAALEHCCWAENDRLVRIVRTNDGTTVCRIDARPGSSGVEPVLSPDGRYVAVRYRGWAVDVWDSRANPPKLLFREKAADPSAIAFTADGTRMALGQQDAVRIVALPEGRELHRVEFPGGGQVTRVVWHPSQPLLACCRYDSWQVDLVDAEAGKVTGSLKHQAAVTGVSWNPVWPFLGVGVKNSAHFWETNSRKLVLSVPAHEATGTRLQFNPGGTLVATVAWDHALALWSAPVGNPIARVRVGPVGRMQFSPDGLEIGPELANGKIRTWRVIPEAELRLYTLLAHDGLQPAISPDGKVLAVGMPTKGTLLWDLRTGQVLDHLLSPVFERLRFVSDDVLLGLQPGRQAGQSGIYRIPVNREHGQLGVPRPLLTTSARMTCEVDATPDGGLVAQGTANGVALWRLRPGEVTAAKDELPKFDPTTRHNPLRRTLSGLIGGLAGGKFRDPDQSFPAPDGRYVSLSPDGRWLACGSHLSQGVRVWRVDDGQLVTTLPTSTWTFVAFGPAGRWLATHDGTCRLWRVGSWEEGPTIAPSDRRRSIRPALSPDDSLIAFGDGHEQVRLVDTASGRELARFEVTQVPHRLDFSRDGRWLLGVSERGAVGVLDLLLLRRGVEKMGVGWNLPVPPENHPREP